MSEETLKVDENQDDQTFRILLSKNRNNQVFNP